MRGLGASSSLNTLVLPASILSTAGSNISMPAIDAWSTEDAKYMLSLPSSPRVNESWYVYAVYPPPANNSTYPDAP